MTKRPLSPEDARAWARVARSIRSISPEPEDFDALIKSADANPSPAPKNTPKIPTPASKKRPISSTQPVPAGPANRQRERRIRRGQLDIAATFDLHGHTQASADRALPVFFIRQRAQNARCVLVITGKGRLGEGVLKRNFLNWLATPSARTLVSGYAEAHRRHGGSGAYYVFLRRMSPS
jgi:DNA-nicking Smr family endonuclease